MPAAPEFLPLRKGEVLPDRLWADHGDPEGVCEGELWWEKCSHSEVGVSPKQWKQKVNRLSEPIAFSVGKGGICCSIK